MWHFGVKIVKSEIFVKLILHSTVRARLHKHWNRIMQAFVNGKIVSGLRSDVKNIMKRNLPEYQDLRLARNLFLLLQMALCQVLY